MDQAELPLILVDPSHQNQFLKGIKLFNQEEFYQCHDVLEEIWLEETGKERLFLQGMIQAAVAFYHYQNGKRGAARSMLRRALEKLRAAEAVQQHRISASFLFQLQQWKDALDGMISTGDREPLSVAFPKVKV